MLYVLLYVFFMYVLHVLSFIKKTNRIKVSYFMFFSSAYVFIQYSVLLPKVEQLWYFGVHWWKILWVNLIFSPIKVFLTFKMY